MVIWLLPDVVTNQWITLHGTKKYTGANFCLHFIEVGIISLLILYSRPHTPMEEKERNSLFTQLSSGIYVHWVMD